MLDAPRQNQPAGPTWRLPVYSLLSLGTVVLLLAAARAATGHWRLQGMFSDIADFSSHWQLAFVFDHTLAFYGALSELGIVLLAGTALLAAMRFVLPIAKDSPLAAGRPLWALVAGGFALQAVDDQVSLHEYLGAKLVALTAARVPGVNHVEDLWFPILGLLAVGLAWRYRVALRPHARFLWLLPLGLAFFAASSAVDIFGPSTEASQAAEEGSKLFAIASFFLFQLTTYLQAVDALALGSSQRLSGTALPDASGPHQQLRETGSRSLARTR